MNFFFLCSFLMNTNAKQVDDNANDEKMNDEKMKNEKSMKII